MKYQKSESNGSGSGSGSSGGGGGLKGRHICLLIFAFMITLVILALVSANTGGISAVDDKLKDVRHSLDNVNVNLQELGILLDQMDVPLNPPPEPIPEETLYRMINGVYGGRDPASTNLASEWNTHGKNVYNSRHAHGSKLTPETVINDFSHSFTCDFHVGASVTSTPAFENEVDVYFPAWNGKVYKYSTTTCTKIWETNIYVDVYGSNSSLTFNLTTVTSRTTPVIWNDYIIIGTLRPADLILLNKYTGAFVRRLNLHTHPYAVVTASGTLSNDWLLTSTASNEESAASSNAYPCCSYYGTMHGIDLNAWLTLPPGSSFVSWTTPTIPPGLVGPGLWSGIGVWGSSPAVDERTNTVYFATGNPYDTPSYYEDCVSAELANAVAENRAPELEITCNRPYALNVYYESVVALDITTGAVKSFVRTGAYDSWNVACSLHRNNCPAMSGQDADYGMAPMLDYAVKCGVCDVNTDGRFVPHSLLDFELPDTVRGFCYDLALGRLVMTYACPKDAYDYEIEAIQSSLEFQPPPALLRQLDPRNIPILYVGQKNGMMHCIAAEKGVLQHIWIDQMCPGGALAGIHWGAAYDDKRVYASCTNNLRLRWTLPNGTHTNCSGWQSYDKYTGERLWATINPACFDPTGSVDNPLPGANGRGYTTASSGPVSISDGVVFVTSSDTVVTPSWPSLTPVGGHGAWVYALNATNGLPIWSYETGYSIYGGFSIGERCVYTGIGYRNFGALGPWATGTSVLAFCSTIPL